MVDFAKCGTPWLCMFKDHCERNTAESASWQRYEAFTPIMSDDGECEGWMPNEKLKPIMRANPGVMKNELY